MEEELVAFVTKEEVAADCGVSVVDVDGKKELPREEAVMIMPEYYLRR